MNSKRHYTIFFIAMLIAILPINSQAAYWYVDSSASGTNSGTSWANAWQSFNDIEWGPGGVIADDTVYISGGLAGKTYSGPLTIGASGISAAVPITIRTGAQHPTLSAGHSGLVTISGGTNGINFGNHDYVFVNGGNSAPHNFTDYNLRITASTADGVIAGSCAGIKLLFTHIFQCGTGSDHDNVQFGSSPGVYPTEQSEIAYCDIDSPMTDALKIAYNYEPDSFGNTIAHHNWIHGMADDGLSGDGGFDFYDNIIGPWGLFGVVGHPDGLQLYAGNLRIYNNIIRAGPNWQGSNGLIFITNAFGENHTMNDVYIYNNLIYTYDMSYTGHRFQGIFIYASTPSVASMDNFYVVNNTLVDVGAYAIRWSGRDSAQSTIFTNSVVKNNIFYNTSHGSPTNDAIAFYDFNVAESDIDVDRNVFYEGIEGGAGIRIGSSSYTVDEFNSTFGKSNINAQPNFLRYTPGSANSSDFHLDSSDKLAINTGTPLSLLPGMDSSWPSDKDGVSRPQGMSWDIGAFEYSGPYSLDTIPPGPARALTITDFSTR